MNNMWKLTTEVWHICEDEQIIQNWTNNARMTQQHKHAMSICFSHNIGRQLVEDRHYQPDQGPPAKAPKESYRICKFGTKLKSPNWLICWAHYNIKRNMWSSCCRRMITNNLIHPLQRINNTFHTTALQNVLIKLLQITTASTFMTANQCIQCFEPETPKNGKCELRLLVPWLRAPLHTVSDAVKYSRTVAVSIAFAQLLKQLFVHWVGLSNKFPLYSP